MQGYSPNAWVAGKASASGQTDHPGSSGMMNPAGSAYRHQRCLEQAMSDPQSLNIYSPADLAILPAGERVFISHRRTDKPLAEAVAAVLGAQGVHYWFDKDDEDTQRAVDLGMARRSGAGAQHRARYQALFTDARPVECGDARIVVGALRNRFLPLTAGAHELSGPGVDPENG